jgi:hypothetical protein
LPGATVVHLSQPVPEAAFAAQWGQPGSMRHLSSYWHRHEAMCLTAKSGVLANLRLLAVGPGGAHEVGAAGCGLTYKVFEAAAEAGQLAICQWLKEACCPWRDDIVFAAARGGHTDVVLWISKAGCTRMWPLVPAARAGHAELCRRLVAEGDKCCEFAAGAAAKGGHAELMRWFLSLSQEDPEHTPFDGAFFLADVASGLDLATLQARTL